MNKIIPYSVEEEENVNGCISFIGTSRRKATYSPYKAVSNSTIKIIHEKHISFAPNVKYLEKMVVITNPL